MRLIIKPLAEDYQFVEVGVTTIEKLISDDQKIAEDKYVVAFDNTDKGVPNKYMGHAVGQIIQTTATTGKKAGNKMTDFYKRSLSDMIDNNNKKHVCFMQNMILNNYVTIGERYNCYAHEVPMYLFVECGKYLLGIRSGGFDMIDDERMYDNKFYGSYFKDKDKNNMGIVMTNKDNDQQITYKEYDGKIYTKDDRINTDLRYKTQRYYYPYMYHLSNEGTQQFQYNIVVKNSALKSNFMPAVQEIRIDVDMARAEEQIKTDITHIFGSHFNKETLEFECVY